MEKNPDTLAKRIHEAKRDAGLLPPDDAETTNYGRGLSLGLELAVSVIVCTFIGVGLDRWLESKPWFMLLGLLLGLVAGLWSMYRVSLGAGQLSVGVTQKDTEKDK